MRMIVVWLPYWKRFRMPAWVFLVYWIGLQLLSFAVGDGPGWIPIKRAGQGVALQKRPVGASGERRSEVLPRSCCWRVTHFADRFP
jgi:hypothetical protein